MVNGDRILAALIAFVAMVFMTASAAAAQTQPSQDQLKVCGVLSEHTPATAQASGKILLGSRVLMLAAGASSPATEGRPPAVGAATCVSATQGATGALTSYVFAGVPSPACGTVTSVTSPQASARGELVLASFFRIFIASGTTLAPSAASGARCFEVAIDAGGDAAVVREVPNPQPAPTLPAGTPAPAPPFNVLPSTTTGSPVTSFGVVFIVAAVVAGGLVALARRPRTLGGGH
jgi:hypothetical protein